MTDIKRSSAAATRQPRLSGPEGSPAFQFSDYGDFLEAAWARRRITLLAAVVLATVGAAWSLLSPRRYEASLTLAVVPPILGEPVVSTVPPQAIEERAVANFAPILSSHAAVASVVTEFKLDQPPREISPTVFLDRVLTVKPLPDTNLVRVTVELDDPRLAANVANRLVDVAIALARTVTEKGISATLHDLQRVLDESDKRLREAETRYQEYRRAGRGGLAPKLEETILEQRGASGPPRAKAPPGAEAAWARLDLEWTIARKSLETAASHYHAAQLEASGRRPQVVVVDSAVPPENPVSHPLVRNTGLGLLAGALLGLLLAVGSMMRRATDPA
jgi:uncharacterized protein involved in exopolysaccharide biosynthesis